MENIPLRLKFLHDSVYGGTQEEMGILVGVSQQQWQRYESGKTAKVPNAFLRKCEELLSVSLSWMIEGTVTPALGKKIKAIREKELKTKGKFAESLGVPEKFIDAVEAGKIEPSGLWLDALCKKYSSNKATLLDESQLQSGSTVVMENSNPYYAVKEHETVLRLLNDDPEAEPFVIDLLRARKATREAASRLAGK
jgi:transcriptional regulator with XRE-family HTH domain